MIEQFTALLEHPHWIFQIFAVVLIALTIDLIQRITLKRLLVRAEQRTKNLWDDAILRAMQPPLTLLIWVTGIAFSARIAQHETPAIIFDAITPLRDIGVISALTWFLIRLSKQGQRAYIEGRKRKRGTIDESMVDSINRLLRSSILITSALVMLQTLGYSISGVLAFGGLSGVVVGFAAKDLLANLFGGLMIHLDRPFSPGDWIRSPDQNIEGTVEEVGWRLTKVRTFDKRPLYIPNATFSNISVENPQRMSHRRIKETIGIRYCDADKMETIINRVRAMLVSHPEIDNRQTLIVNFNAFAPSSLDFFIYTFTKTTNWVRFHEVKQDVLLQIIEIIDQCDAEIAFPTSTLHLPDPVQYSALP
ncbi:MAG: mechanosensitive ion channel family protein [Gammaproteobacteria bacterium]|jgi:MscS family membrane protein|nr:mechanosensitive ion channel family protein [Gammaproteobacteria bacterium]MBT3488501.1 mechanosensitive ion channel family protein [Gammaproteobacteria bacterium]MBT3719043.1 mechanosensitive ion channel family protein [Gammaproteobacteria bacterium]MBT3844230.1 mechanosensitive ion channel family protein [Gammaproteobacteria bacterium]MBT3892355.1 mechanosensitive ion channel family protein [Gammaproteobacteria bacterium]